MQPTSLYTLPELLAQRQTAVAIGINPEFIETEIALVVNYESNAARLRHPSNRRPFDYDA